MNYENEKHVIEHYRENEKMMILVYAQWCINNDIDPISLYQEAHPTQITPPSLDNILESTVSKNESENIADETVLQVLQMFGNDDLAFSVQEKINKRKKTF